MPICHSSFSGPKLGEPDRRNTTLQGTTSKVEAKMLETGENANLTKAAISRMYRGVCMVKEGQYDKLPFFPEKSSHSWFTSFLGCLGVFAHRAFKPNLHCEIQ